jgi:Uma2 family endonuclease
MTTMIEKTTAADLERMPDDGFRHELVRGEMRKMSPAGSQHGKIALKFALLLMRHVEERNLGVGFAAETGFLIASDPDTVRAPDVAFVQRARDEEVGDTEKFWPGAPDLAVEVISLSDNYTEVEERVVDWLQAGTRMVVVVNPRQRRVMVHRAHSDVQVLGEGDTLEGGDVVPGWRLTIAELFA